MSAAAGPSNAGPSKAGRSNAGPPTRWELMSARVERTARAAGVDGSGRDLIRSAIETAMAPRLATIEDDHDHDYLHPGRTVVVLLDDVGLYDPVALAAACLLDTRRLELEAPDRDVSDHVSPAVTAFRNAVPRSGSDALLEDLLSPTSSSWPWRSASTRCATRISGGTCRRPERHTKKRPRST